MIRTYDDLDVSAKNTFSKVAIFIRVVRKLGISSPSAFDFTVKILSKPR